MLKKGSVAYSLVFIHILSQLTIFLKLRDLSVNTTETAVKFTE